MSYLFNLLFLKPSFALFYKENLNLLDIIIVKDSGIDSTLILQNKINKKILKDDGLILSEYPGYVIPTLKTWNDSNRIKIGLSKGIFLINSLKEKITFKLIRKTLEEGKEVYALNKIMDNKTHNDILISKGAYPINEIENLKE